MTYIDQDKYYYVIYCSYKTLLAKCQQITSLTSLSKKQHLQAQSQINLTQ